MSVTELLHRVTEVAKVRDLPVEKSDIESIVRAIYTREG
jgi:ABC-type uncharacterized transport system ATPase subunit